MRILIGPSLRRPLPNPGQKAAFLKSMQTSARPADVLFFRCGPCGTELSVPLALQGIEGPCPCCGQHIKAPSYQPRPVPQVVHLPPLDRRHETAGVPVESAPALDWGDFSARPDLAMNSSLPEANPPATEDSEQRSVSPRLLPRQLTSHAAQGFQARLAIPLVEEPPVDSPPASGQEVIHRKSAGKKVDRVLSGFFDSSFFRIFRVALLVTTGGLCAGLVLYLKDRNWVLDLPWRPSRVETVVEVPLAGPAAAPRPADPVNPFLGEDPSELNGISYPQVLAPLPDVTAVPVGASPIAGGKK